MAFRYGLRLALIAAATLCTATFSATASNYFDSGGTRTTSVTADYDGGTVFVLSYADVLPALKLDAVAEAKQIVRDYPAYRSHSTKPQASIASLRPTSVSGWRSGRVRTLAG